LTSCNLHVYLKRWDTSIYITRDPISLLTKQVK
jgi:hypothetical protein